MPGMHDWNAKRAWGHETYDAIPKSVFALIAWHLANLAAEELDSGLAPQRFLEEWDILTEGGHMPQVPTRKVRAALVKLEDL